MNNAVKNYLTVTFGYWGFTITDGAIRMLVVLHFHQLGYSPFEVAMLFLFYEFFGIITNLVGGWLGSRIGLNNTMHLGMLLQIVALTALTVPSEYLSVPFVMAAQALSGIAKDLNKMSAKASVKAIVSETSDNDKQLFKWVAILTGSKNTLKGVGFFLGGALLQWIGFQATLWVLALSLLVIFIVTWILLPSKIGQLKNKVKFTQVFSQNPSINWLSASRLFLFGSRDTWFVVALPVFLYEVLHWSFTQVGTLMALWVIVYGFVQAFTPKLINRQQAPNHRSAVIWGGVLAVFPALMAIGLNTDFSISYIIIGGLVAFGIVFAINSAIHSYLILAYSDHDKVSMNVGFYYMANAAGRLIGTVISGWSYQSLGLQGCLWISSFFIVIATLLSLKLPNLK